MYIHKIIIQNNNILLYLGRGNIRRKNNLVVPIVTPRKKNESNYYTWKKNKCEFENGT